MTVDYESASRFYDASRSAGPLTVRMLARLLNVGPSCGVLDIGCGTGNFMMALGKRAASVVGVDTSPGMLSQAAGKGLEGQLVRGDALALPFADGAFDAAYGVQVLHHLRDKAAAVREAYRVLKRGGVLALQYCSRAQLQTFCCYHYFPAALPIDQERIPDTPAVLELLAGAGFIDCRVEACPMEGRSTGRFYIENPEDYLSEEYRAGNSTFALMAERDIEEGCRRIRADLQSGDADKIAAEFERRARAGIGRVSFAYARKAASTGALHG
ncbi:MAG: methyltransferase domain-containing protein [Armatimonadota bacterium]|nr:MAG: methyltransferase domain-containing protein [Armatimonadota bacterium]